MEEDFNQQTESTEKTETQLSREEILAISREENKNGDERDAQIYKRAMQLAFCIGVIVLGIIGIVSVIVIGETPIELYIVYMAMAAMMGLYCGIKSSKHRALFLAAGIVCTVAFVIMTVLWILKLCGVGI